MMTQSYGWNLQRLQHSRNEINLHTGILRDARADLEVLVGDERVGKGAFLPTEGGSETGLQLVRFGEGAPLHTGAGVRERAGPPRKKMNFSPEISCFGEF